MALVDFKFLIGLVGILILNSSQLLDVLFCRSVTKIVYFSTSFVTCFNNLIER